MALTLMEVRKGQIIVPFIAEEMQDEIKVYTGKDGCYYVSLSGQLVLITVLGSSD
jgi:hypothetical protein